MALYAFDGTWSSDEDELIEQTNVVRFCELYVGNNTEYVNGVGTRFGNIGRVLGGLFGSGGRTRIAEMYDELCENWERGDRVIDIVGFSRGAALAVHFANKIGEDGIQLSDGNSEDATIRFLGIWDIVGSFGLSFDTVVNFQEINLGWNLDTIHNCVENCYHAMALDERRKTFNVTRVDPDNNHDNIYEVWFRGVHGDIGGGNKNVERSNIALNWMLDQARACGLFFNETKAGLPRYSAINLDAKISENLDVRRDDRRSVMPGDAFHLSAAPIRLEAGQDHSCEVIAELRYNWTRVRLEAGARYTYTVAPEDTWSDADIICGPDGWRSEDLPWYKEGLVQLAERFRRLPDENWFALSGALSDEDDELFYIGGEGRVIESPRDADLYLFANDLRSKYSNNQGSLVVTITRIS